MATLQRTCGPSLAQLRQALRDGALSDSALTQLRRDPRAGAQALWAQHRAKVQADVVEQQRLHRLQHHERALWARGLTHVGGLDEVGVGPLLGPVVAVVVVLPPNTAICGVNDSKKLSPKRRELLCREILAQATGVGTGLCSAQEIDASNIYWASKEAMRRAVMNLPCALQHLLVDAHRVPGIRIPQTALIQGDATSHAIAAASIVAKVTRDSMMAEFDRTYPEYGLAQHKGYGTHAHLRALKLLGPTPQHRRSFAPVRDAARALGH